MIKQILFIMLFLNIGALCIGVDLCNLEKQYVFAPPKKRLLPHMFARDFAHLVNVRLRLIDVNKLNFGLEQNLNVNEGVDVAVTNLLRPFVLDYNKAEVILDFLMGKINFKHMFEIQAYQIFKTETLPEVSRITKNMIISQGVNFSSQNLHNYLLDLLFNQPICGFNNNLALNSTLPIKDFYHSFKGKKTTVMPCATKNLKDHRVNNNKKPLAGRFIKNKLASKNQYKPLTTGDEAKKYHATLKHKNTQQNVNINDKEDVYKDTESAQNIVKLGQINLTPQHRRYDAYVCNNYTHTLLQLKNNCKQHLYFANFEEGDVKNLNMPVCNSIYKIKDLDFAIKFASYRDMESKLAILKNKISKFDIFTSDQQKNLILMDFCQLISTNVLINYNWFLFKILNLTKVAMMHVGHISFDGVIKLLQYIKVKNKNFTFQLFNMVAPKVFYIPFKNVAKEQNYRLTTLIGLALSNLIYHKIFNGVSIFDRHVGYGFLLDNNFDNLQIDNMLVVKIKFYYPMGYEPSGLCPHMGTRFLFYCSNLPI